MTSRTIPSTLSLRQAPRRGTGWLAWLGSMMDAIQGRRCLASMDDRMLADIGISRAEALKEAGRLPWDS